MDTTDEGRKDTKLHAQYDLNSMYFYTRREKDCGQINRAQPRGGGNVDCCLFSALYFYISLKFSTRTL